MTRPPGNRKIPRTKSWVAGAGRQIFYRCPGIESAVDFRARLFASLEVGHCRAGSAWLHCQWQCACQCQWQCQWCQQWVVSAVPVAVAVVPAVAALASGSASIATRICRPPYCSRRSSERAPERPEHIVAERCHSTRYASALPRRDAFTACRACVPLAHARQFPWIEFAALCNRRLSC